MRGLIGTMLCVAVVGCTGQKGPTPQQIADAAACYSQAEVLASTIRAQVPACIALAQDVQHSIGK